MEARIAWVRQHVVNTSPSHHITTQEQGHVVGLPRRLALSLCCPHGHLLHNWMHARIGTEESKRGTSRDL
jgi:hypothetical protein